MGVDENHFVAVKMGHVKEFVPAIIGIQKAGSAYVPVDPEYPKDRIDYMLEDSEAKVVLTEELLADIIAKYKDVESINRATPAHRAYSRVTAHFAHLPHGGSMCFISDKTASMPCIQAFPLMPRWMI